MRHVFDLAFPFWGTLHSVRMTVINTTLFLKKMLHMNTPQRLGCVVLGCLDCQAVVPDLGRVTSLDTLTLQRLVAGAAYLFAGCMYR